MTWTNPIDIFLCLVVLCSLLFGWQRGLILGVVDLVRWIGSLLIGLRFYGTVASRLSEYFTISQVWSAPIAFLLTVAVAGVVIHSVLFIVVRRLPPAIHRSFINRLFGIVPGFVNGLITVAILSPIIMALPLPDELRNTARESGIANRVAVVSQRIETALSPVFDNAVRQTLNLLTVRPEPESTESVKLPFTVKSVSIRPDLAAQMLLLLNDERAKAGLKPLIADAELADVGRKHSSDMFARGYFSHYTPEGESPFDRMNAAGVKYVSAGENLALAPTLMLAHNGLMNSPGHRANILRPQFGRVGIGIVDGGVRGLMISQEFKN